MKKPFHTESTVRPLVNNWEGPHFRFFQGGLEYSETPWKPHALFMDALEPEGSWIYVLRGTIHYEIGPVRHQVIKGQALVTRRPDPGWLIRSGKDLPIYILWIHVTGEVALRMFDYIHIKYGQIQTLPRQCEAVTRGIRLIKLAAARVQQPASYWSEQTFLWMNAWLRCSAEEHGPDPRVLLNAPKPSRLLSFAPKTIKTFAAEMGYSRSYLSRKLHEQWLESPGKLLRKARLEEGARLLRSTQLSVREVSLRIGYSTTSSFSRAFTDMYHQPPLAYRHSEL